MRLPVGRPRAGAGAHGGYHALRQRLRLREWLYDGADRAAPCATARLAAEGRFAPLLRRLLAWWRGGHELAPAVDAMAGGERLMALVVSVLYRGGAMAARSRWSGRSCRAPRPGRGWSSCGGC